MYGEYESIIIYGVTDSYARVLDKKWLSKNYPKLEIHALNIVKHYRCQPIYGIECEFDTASGVAHIDESDKKLVDEFWQAFKEHHEKNQTKFFDIDCVFGFHQGIYGDYSVVSTCDEYILDT